MERICKKCKQQKEESEFSIDRVQYKYTCKDCNKKPENYVCRISPFTKIDGEEWRPVVGYEGLYEISNLGRVKNLRKKRINDVWHTETLMKPKNNKEIYHRVELSKSGNRKITGVHQLVAAAFINNPENKPNINHINGKRDDNRIENLEWCTQKENIQHAWDTGLSKARKGGHHQSSKAIMIIDIIKNSVTSIGSLKAGAKYLGIGHSTICRYASGQVKNDRYTFEYI